MKNPSTEIRAVEQHRFKTHTFIKQYYIKNFRGPFISKHKSECQCCRWKEKIIKQEYAEIKKKGVHWEFYI